MKDYIKHDPWSIIEEGFDPANNKISESLFSLGNGSFGQRANFEEKYSGPSLQGNYIAGVYYPDKTRVGWWKNGYPEYFAKVLNAADWIGIGIAIEGEELDLHLCEVSEFRRELNMKEGWLERSFTAELPSGKRIKVKAKRFCSMARSKVGAISYEVTPINFSCDVVITPFIDADVMNSDSNYDEKFWIEQEKKAEIDFSYVIASTKKTDFWVCTAMSYEIKGAVERKSIETNERLNYVEVKETLSVRKGESFIIYKYASNVSTLDADRSELLTQCRNNVAGAQNSGYAELLKEQIKAWADKWE
ncbi:MAG: glycoside hydrolase family 65 protein, partial [Flavobacteriales bacterium]|nr:glycoside hydrolase family 65 protein [Flavobacteriales bacterium]